MKYIMEQRRNQKLKFLSSEWEHNGYGLKTFTQMDENTNISTSERKSEHE